MQITVEVLPVPWLRASLPARMGAWTTKTTCGTLKSSINRWTWSWWRCSSACIIVGWRCWLTDGVIVRQWCRIALQGAATATSKHKTPHASIQDNLKGVQVLMNHLGNGQLHQDSQVSSWWAWSLSKRWIQAWLLRHDSAFQWHLPRLVVLRKQRKWGNCNAPRDSE